MSPRNTADRRKSSIINEKIIVHYENMGGSFRESEAELQDADERKGSIITMYENIGGSFMENPESRASTGTEVRARKSR